MNKTKTFILWLWVAMFAALPAFCGDMGNYRLTELTIDFTGTNKSGSVTSSDAFGYIHEILIDSPGASLTGTVAVTANRTISTMSALTLVSNTISNDCIVHPIDDYTDAVGAAQTSETTRRPLLLGETVTFAVSAATTSNQQWRCIIKTEK